MLQSLSPLDGRYAETASPLRRFFSEEALIRARLLVEVSYFLALSREKGIAELPQCSDRQQKQLWEIVQQFTSREADLVKKIEAKTNHDVKAVEYYLKEKMSRIRGLGSAQEFVHFALTSEDTNNLAYGILIHEALKEVIVPQLLSLVKDLNRLARSWSGVPMLSLTHGQPATPTTVGKELMVFVHRLDRQMRHLKNFRMQGKLGGAVGNFSAHRSAYPEIKWEGFRDRFVKALGLDPISASTQINPHDDSAELSHMFCRINTILLGLSRDMWMYIARGVFHQKVIASETGSSTMPHKVNPIDFENAEGNLGLSIALFSHFAEKLPVSRLQRDLSDSTVQRSIGTAFGYHFLAMKSLQKGFGKIILDRAAVKAELAAHPEVAAEAIQTMLRKHGVKGAYEQLKNLTRGEAITREKLCDFVHSCQIPDDEKQRLLKML